MIKLDILKKLQEIMTEFTKTVIKNRFGGKSGSGDQKARITIKNLV